MSAYATKLHNATGAARAAYFAAVAECGEEVLQLLQGVIDRLEEAEKIRQKDKK